MNIVPSVILFIKAVEDGKITGKELKQFLNSVIPDNLEFSLSEVLPFIKTILQKF